MKALLPNWSLRLSDYIETVKTTPFDWKSHNCATFVNDAHRAMTGVGFCDDLVGEYSTSKEALIYYRDLKNKGGYHSVLDILDDRLTRTFRWPERGMFVACRTEKMATGHALGVCVGAGTNAFVGYAGIEFIPVGEGDATWLA